MKKIVALLLGFVLIFLSGCAAASETDGSENSTAPGSLDENSFESLILDSGLSHETLCYIRPTFYSNRRSRKIGQETVRDIDGDFSAQSIKNAQGFLEYGLFIKFTPGVVDDDYQIFKMDVVLYAPSGKIVEIESYDQEMTCKAGIPWCWEFYSLDSVFEKMIYDQGEVMTGTYTMDIYFNNGYAGYTQFRVQK